MIVDDATEYGGPVLNLESGVPLINSLGVADVRDAAAQRVLQNVDPVTILTGGQRSLEKPNG